MGAHVPNMQPANQYWGQSDLVDLLPINRELDERLSDQADLIKYHADPPVVFKGVTDHSDLAEWPTQTPGGGLITSARTLRGAWPSAVPSIPGAAPPAYPKASPCVASGGL